MPRLIFVAYLILLILGNLSGQVYHYETGKVIPINKPDTILWENGVYNTYPADYGTLVVNENRNNRDSRLINLPVIRIKALNADSITKPVFLLNGGPGESNFQPQLFFDELLEHHDIVIVGYRGVDGSTSLQCPCMKNALLDDSITINNASVMFNFAVDSCLTTWKDEKIDIRGYTMDEVVDDIEITRKLLKYKHIDFLSFSYGTMLSQLYSEKYPSHVDKMVLIGARPLNDFMFTTDEINTQIYKIYKRYCKKCLVTGADSIATVMANLDQSLSQITENMESVNLYRLLFFAFSKAYSTQELDNLVHAFKDAQKDHTKQLKQLYNDFYKNFPGDLVIGDMILKKQGRVLVSDTLQNNISKVLNDWYNPVTSNFSVNPGILKSIDDTIPKLFISGEFDVAAPVYKLNSCHECNQNILVVPGAGHLDLLLKFSDDIVDIVTKYFTDNTQINSR